MSLISNRQQAYLGGGTATAVAIMGTLLVNVSTQSEAKQLLEALLPATRFFSSAVMGATATILALMLTLLAFSSNKDVKLEKRHYERIRDIAKAGAAVLICATVLLLLQAIPIVEEAQEVSANIYTIAYYSIFFASALMCGGLVTVVLLLLGAIQDLINVAHPEKESEVVAEQSD